MLVGILGKLAKKKKKWVKKKVSLPTKGQLCDILGEFSGTSHLLPPTRTAQCSPEPVQTLLIAVGLWCRGAVLQVDFSTRHYFCSFTLPIHFIYRIKILAPVKSLGPVPVGTKPGFSPALRMPYRK